MHLSPIIIRIKFYFYDGHGTPTQCATGVLMLFNNPAFCMRVLCYLVRYLNHLRCNFQPAPREKNFIEDKYKNTKYNGGKDYSRDNYSNQSRIHFIFNYTIRADFF